MIIFGGWLLFSGNGGPQASVSNLWDRAVSCRTASPDW
ncbi:hypothetical protein ACLK2F_00635 [Escherichia coli]